MSNTYKYKLWVEGRDDQYVIQNLLVRHKISSVIPDRIRGIRIKEHTISIEQQGGFDNLRKKLIGQLKDPELERVGIIVDADDPTNPSVNIRNRWESIKAVTARFDDVVLPDDPNLDGTIGSLQRADGSTLVVGIWIMPNNQLPGTLEGFIKFLVPADRTSLWNRAEHSVNEIPLDERLFRPIDQQKVYLATWLAWQKHPGIPLGAAINQRYLDANAPQAHKLIDWIRRLFALTVT